MRRIIIQSNEMAEKKKVNFDGVETPGLVSVGEIAREKGTVDVPSFRKIRPVQNGVVKNPEITLVYKVERNTNTLQFFDDYFDDNEVKDMEVIRTDAHGVEFNRVIYTECEVKSITEPAYDAANPDYAKTTVVLIYNERIKI